MKKLFLTISLLIGIMVNAQVSFGEQNAIIQSETNYARFVFAADIDGDGDMDMLTASSSKIAWYENTDGNGSYGIQQIIISNNIDGVNTVFATDIDGDGDMDVLFSTQYGNSKIAWCENTDGSGTFGLLQIISTEVYTAKYVFAADIDGDGDMDVLSASYSDNKIAWYENTDGSGTFGTQQVITTNASGASSVYASDIDGDGDMDVLSASRFDDKIAWYENIDGAGTFGAQQVITTNADSAHSVYAEDIDGDGDSDVLSASWGDDKIAWYENTDGNGTFGAQQIITTNADGANTVYAIDIDGDGDSDVLSASWGDDKIAWYENINGNGAFGTQQIVASSVQGASSVFSIDIDSDGDMDVLSASIWDNKIAWYENINGIGNFDHQKIISSSANYACSVFAVDIDGDGDPDVLSASKDDNKIAWYENTDGNGTFGDQQIITTNAEGASYVFATDIDGDGDPDVLSASDTDDKIAWYENTDGNGTFGAQQIITTNADGANTVYAIDIDGDGDPDVLSASKYDNKIAWYENIDGTGTFGLQQIISSDVGGATSVYATDIDGDGDMDVLSASEISDYINKIAWYENTDGNGTFGAQQIITTNIDGANTVYATDIDGDGDMDVLSSSANDYKIAWYENTDGNGNFGYQQIISTNNYSYQCVFAADIDGDGDMDVLSASRYYGEIAWYENLGPTTNKITGMVTTNLAGNCNTPIPNILVKTNNSAESLSTFSLINGIYQLFPETGNFTTEIEPVSIPNYYTANPSLYNDNFSDIGNVVTHNFCLEPNQTVNDVNISILPLNQARPGFDVTYKIVYKNVGTTQLNGNIILEFDNTKLTFLNANETVNLQTSNSLTFNYSNLNPFETKTINIEFNILAPPTVNIDDVLTYTATVNPVANDFTPDDNVYTLNQTVIGSYDPNDITVLEGDEILLADTDKYLHYVIRFQNTGTASALKVVVKNILDANLDWSTLQLESISHDNHVEIKNGNEVSFIFNAIYLPDSTTDEPNSHGYIAYKIKPKANIALGDVILNKADIFFDFNTPIETNTVTTTIVNSLSVNDNTLLNFLVYPTPTENILHIKSKTEISKIEIFNKLGQKIKNISNNQIDISNLNQGLYFVKATDVNGNFGIKKIVKK